MFSWCHNYDDVLLVMQLFSVGVVYIAYNFDFEFVFVDAVVVFVDDDVITVH